MLPGGMGGSPQLKCPICERRLWRISHGWQTQKPWVQVQDRRPSRQCPVLVVPARARDQGTVLLKDGRSPPPPSPARQSRPDNHRVIPRRLLGDQRHLPFLHRDSDHDHRMVLVARRGGSRPRCADWAVSPMAGLQRDIQRDNANEHAAHAADEDPGQRAGLIEVRPGAGDPDQDQQEP